MEKDEEKRMRKEADKTNRKSKGKSAMLSALFMKKFRGSTSIQTSEIT